MDKEKFIKQQVELLKNDIAESDIMYNIRTNVFNEAEPKDTMDTLINRCMELYAEIYLETYRE